MEQEFRNKGLIWEDPLSNPSFLDLRLNEEKQIEREIYTGIRLNSDFDTSATEFVETDCIRDFISGSSNFNRNGQHMRTHETVEQSRTGTFCNQPTSWQVLVQPMHNLECASIQRVLTCIENCKHHIRSFQQSIQGHQCAPFTSHKCYISQNMDDAR